jgi:hypothetical protein
VLDRDGGKALAYQESQGFLPLRESLAGYLSSNGINANENCIQIISGAQQGIDIIAKSLLKAGDSVIPKTLLIPGLWHFQISRGSYHTGALGGRRYFLVCFKTGSGEISSLTDLCNTQFPNPKPVFPIVKKKSWPCWDLAEPKGDIIEDAHLAIYLMVISVNPLNPGSIWTGNFYQELFQNTDAGLRLAFLSAPEKIILVCSKQNTLPIYPPRD